MKITGCALILVVAAVCNVSAADFNRGQSSNPSSSSPGNNVQPKVGNEVMFWMDCKDRAECEKKGAYRLFGTVGVLKFASTLSRVEIAAAIAKALQEKGVILESGELASLAEAAMEILGSRYGKAGMAVAAAAGVALAVDAGRLTWEKRDDEKHTEPTRASLEPDHSTPTFDPELAAMEATQRKRQLLRDDKERVFISPYMRSLLEPSR